MMAKTLMSLLLTTSAVLLLFRINRIPLSSTSPEALIAYSSALQYRFKLQALPTYPATIVSAYYEIPKGKKHSLEGELSYSLSILE